MVRVSPHLKRPRHFRKYADLLQSGVGGGLRVVFSAPPQHGKTMVTLHALAWVILRYPTLRHAYVTYSQGRARSVARSVCRILQAAGMHFGGGLSQLTFPEGGQCLFTSIDGGITGEPVDGLCIIDDPVKNRKEADSARRREVIREAYTDAIETRVHEGASIFLLATRWHPDDLSGTCIEQGWTRINLPAIAEADDPNGRAPGEALFPDMWPAEALHKKQSLVGEFTWSALYQGHPRPKGGTVFHEPTYYTKLPESYSGGFGVDLAYTAKTNSDHSICLEMWREDRFGMDPLYYVRHVDRAQVEAPVFMETLKERSQHRPHWNMLWRASGTEKGAAQFIQMADVPLAVQNPPGDKFVAAQSVAAAWNAGRVMVPDPEAFPEVANWLDAFLDIVMNFTGTGKEHDDDVDALGNAFEVCEVVDSGVGTRVRAGSR